MDWIDYGNVKGYTKAEVAMAFDILSWAKELANEGDKDALQRALDRAHKVFVKWPHEHLASILGPYCIACRCSIPQEHWND